MIDLTSGAGDGGGAGAAGPPGSGVMTGEDTARATLIRARSATVPQGAIIAAVLETPLNSDRPGMARAMVTQDVRGFDGTRVLIPRGSRLIGEFKADATPGQRRILVMWSRLIRPDGVAVRIGSPVADSMGGAGVTGSVNSHAFERFSSAVLQSALTVGVNVASRLGDGGAVWMTYPLQNNQLGQQLVPGTQRGNTIKVREGANIAVLVARDLDFSGMPALR
ncbi:type IV secretion system protein B10 [Novosphingobium sp. FSY-8]|uniref:Type IV secretion system protein B10 n=1 Tax=Novosphingobium ovatum TaxID=1908523 RepID=A0ABW9XAT5_9SPHN|nr:type IV secretion system protein B10 [Novosphingobium ovatum]